MTSHHLPHLPSQSHLAKKKQDEQRSSKKVQTKKRDVQKRKMNPERTLLLLFVSLFLCLLSVLEQN